MFIAFEKQFGDREAIEDVIVGKRRFQVQIVDTHRGRREREREREEEA